MNIEDLIDYEDMDVIEPLFVQYNSVTLKKSFDTLQAGTNLAWFAFNFNTNEYSFAYRSDDDPSQWFKGKINLSFGPPA